MCVWGGGGGGGGRMGRVASPKDICIAGYIHGIIVKQNSAIFG